MFAGTRPDYLGVKDGKLPRPKRTPNNVSSQADPSDAEHYIAPIRFKGTPTEAMAAVRKAVEGMDLLEGRDVVTADTPEALAQAVLEVHGDAARWKTLQAGGEEYINRRFSFSVLDQQLIALTAKLRPA